MYDWDADTDAAQRSHNYETDETEEVFCFRKLNLCSHKSTSLTNLLSHWIISLHISTFNTGTLTRRSPKYGGCWRTDGARCVQSLVRPNEPVGFGNDQPQHISLVCRQAQRAIPVKKLGLRWRKPQRSIHPLSNSTTLETRRLNGKK